MPLPVILASTRAIDGDPRLLPPNQPIVLVCLRLPPARSIAPFPVAFAVGLCPDIGLLPHRYEFGDLFVLAVAVYAGYLCALRIAILHGVLVVPTCGVELETPVTDGSPAFRAGWEGGGCIRCVCVCVCVCMKIRR